MPNQDLIVPGLTLCYRKCGRDAQVIVTEPGRERYPEALCWDCLEDDLEHERAAAVSRKGADLSAASRGELELEEADPDVRELRAKISTPAEEQSRRRCWAYLPDGRRCSRRATVGLDPANPYLCDTHRRGAQIPAQGWTLDGPQGRTVPSLNL